MRIAIFDYQVVRTNPIGGCHRRLLNALAGEHEFTVFSVEFDNPSPEKIEWVRVPAPLRPLPLLFLVYHLMAPLTYAFYRLRTRRCFDVIQMVESKLSFGDVAYTHFCHTAYLKKHWDTRSSKGLRGLSRWLDHRLHASLEHYIYGTVKHVLVPSKGLRTELAEAFPDTSSKLRVLPNAIDVGTLRAPVAFDRSGFRRELGFAASDVVFVFAALGHFERKGLPLLMEALAVLDAKQAKLLIVGGANDLIESYRRRATALGVEEQVVFVGMQTDIGPYLWASDAFAFASSYETFSLVAYEAAAAALPLITPLLHGIEEIVVDGETGFVVKATVKGFADALKRFLELPAEKRSAMGNRARSSVLKYDEQYFVENWRQFYGEWMMATTGTSSAKSMRVA